MVFLICDKIVDIKSKFSTNDSFLEYPSSGMLKVK